MNLIKKLQQVYPDWQNYHDTATEAAIEIGLLDEDDMDLHLSGVRELDFNTD